MRSCLGELGYETKHLLPTGRPGETLLSRNVRLGLLCGLEVQVHANATNMDVIRKHVGSLGVQVVVDPDTRPLGPFTFAHYLEDTTGASVAGDLFISGFDWRQFLRQHAESRYPVSFLVGKVQVAPGNALFETSDDGKINSFRRPTEPVMGLRNIGVYAITPTSTVADIVNDYAAQPTAGLEDSFAKDLIKEGLVGTHIHEGPFFNINGISDYRSLLDYTE